VGIETLKLADIVVDYAVQPRAKGLDQNHVEELAEAYRRDDAVPRPVVWKIGGAYKLSQGFHRVEGARRADVAELECEVHVGTDLECRLDALTSNAEHGLKRTPDDVKRAVEQIVRLCPDWSDRRLAEALKVSHPTVAKYRPRADVETVSTSQTTRLTRTDSAGRRQPASKPKPPPVSAELVGKVAAALRKNAAATDHDLTGLCGCTPAEAKAARKAAKKLTPADEPAPAAPPPDETPARKNEREALTHVQKVEAVCYRLDELAKLIDALKADPQGYSLHADAAAGQVKAVRKQLWVGRACCRCPYCKGDGCKPDKAGRSVCNQTGWVKKSTADAGEEAVGGAA
jgi:hypothetical protein